MNNHYARSSRDFNSTNTGPNSLVEGSSSSLTFQDIHVQFTEMANDVEFIAEDVQEEVQQIPMGCEQQNIIRSASEVREEAAADGDDFHFNDFALFDSSSIGVYEFSREFLAIARRHRFQPKAKAILLDLLQRIMPKDNRCPKTIAEMRKLVTCNQHAYNELFREKSAFFSNSTALKVSETIRPQLHYLLPQQPSTSSDNKPLNIKREIAGPSIIYGLDEHPANNNRDLLPYVLQTIDRLSQEVSVLRMSLSTKVPPSSLRKTNRRTACSSDERAGIRVYDVADKVVLLNSLARQELQRTVDVSRYDANRLIYDHNDITEIILEKIELSSYMHNPSLCGRMVADILFSPEFLSNKHILAEGQFSSRARLEVLPPEMTHLFYESLRKLGVSRIIDEDREYWLYLARDGVNQRARDLKAKRKRKFYTDEHPPIFTTEEQIK